MFLCDFHVNHDICNRYTVDGAVSRSVGLRLERPSNLAQFPAVKRDLFLLQSVHTASETHQAFCSVCTACNIFRGIKQTERELSHPHPCAVHVKDEWSSEFTPS